MSAQPSSYIERALIAVGTIVLTLIASDIYRSVTGNIAFNTRIAVLEQRIDTCNRGTDGLQAQINNRFNDLTNRLEALSHNLNEHVARE